MRHFFYLLLIVPHLVRKSCEVATQCSVVSCDAATQMAPRMADAAAQGVRVATCDAATQSSSVGARDASELFLPRLVTVGSQTATWDVEHELLLTQAALARETELLEMACSMMSKHKVDAARARRRADELQARLDAAFASPGRVAEVATQASLGSATGAGRARRQRRRQSDLQHSDRASCVGVAIQTDGQMRVGLGVGSAGEHRWLRNGA